MSEVYLVIEWVTVIKVSDIISKGILQIVCIYIINYYNITSYHIIIIIIIDVNSMYIRLSNIENNNCRNGKKRFKTSLQINIFLNHNKNN